jgi:plastocyanin
MTDDLKYVPDPVTVMKGGTITWKNTAATVHTAADDPSKVTAPADASLPAGAKAWDSGDVQPGGSFSHTFDTAGTYKYFCVPHDAAGMLARSPSSRNDPEAASQVKAVGRLPIIEQERTPRTAHNVHPGRFDLVLFGLSPTLRQT